MPQLPQIYPYKPGPIERIVVDGEYVGIWVNKVYKFYQVEYIEPLPESDPIQINLGAIAAAAGGAAGQTALTQLTLLEMPDREFGQFRMRVIDDFAAWLFQGRADQRHKLANAVAICSRFTDLKDPCGHTTEFYVHENNWAFLQGFNQTDYALTIARVNFYGFRYVLSEEIKNWPIGSKTPLKYPDNIPEHWTRVPATAHL